MEKNSLTKAYLILLCALHRAGDAQTNPQFGTIGNTYRLVRGQDTDNAETWIERSTAFHQCGKEQLCSYVGRLQSNGSYIMLTSQHYLLNNANVSALWKKEQPQLRNIALNKTTSSAGHEANKSPSKAVDGYKGMRYFDDHCFSAQSSSNNPWWRVDLGQTAIVNSVSVTNAGRGYEDMAKSLENFDIRIGSYDKRGSNQLCRGNITITEATTVNFVCDKEIIGNYVFVEKHKSKLILCEVEVYGIFV